MKHYTLFKDKAINILEVSRLLPWVQIRRGTANCYPLARCTYRLFASPHIISLTELSSKDAKYIANFRLSNFQAGFSAGHNRALALNIIFFYLVWWNLISTGTAINYGVTMAALHA